MPGPGHGGRGPHGGRGGGPRGGGHHRGGGFGGGFGGHRPGHRPPPPPPMHFGGRGHRRRYRGGGCLSYCMMAFIIIGAIISFTLKEDKTPTSTGGE